MRRVLVLLALLAACSRGEKAPPPRDAAVRPPPPAPDARPVATREAPVTGASVAVDGLVEDRIYDEYLVILPSEADGKRAIAAIKKAAKARDLPVLEGDGVTGADRYLVVSSFPSPLVELAAEELAMFATGLTEDSRAMLAKARTTVRVELRVERAALDQGLVEVVACVVAGAEAVRGAVMDVETFELFEASTLRRLRGGDAPIDARRFTMIRVDPASLDRMETAGMSRLGLPELVLRDVPGEVVGGAVLLTYAVAQHLIEHAELTRAGELDLELSKLGTHPWPDVFATIERKGGDGKLTLAATWTKSALGAPAIELSIPSRSGLPEAGYQKLGAMLGDAQDHDPGGYAAAMRRSP